MEPYLVSLDKSRARALFFVNPTPPISPQSSISVAIVARALVFSRDVSRSRRSVRGKSQDDWRESSYRESKHQRCLRVNSKQSNRKYLGHVGEKFVDLFWIFQKYPLLVGVTKIKSKEFVIEAYRCGLRHFGENYVSWFLFWKSNILLMFWFCRFKNFMKKPTIQSWEKSVRKSNGTSLAQFRRTKSTNYWVCLHSDWHWTFIMYLPTDVPNLSMIQTIHTQKLASALNSHIARNDKIQGKIDCLVQVNTSNEDGKIYPPLGTIFAHVTLIQWNLVQPLPIRQIW